MVLPIVKSAKATDPKELLIVLAPIVDSSKGRCKVFESKGEEGKHGTRENEAPKPTR